MDLLRYVPRSLVWRITLLMSVALLPLGLISVYQTRVVVNEAQELSKAALLSETLEAAALEREFIQQALGATQGLASVMTDLDDQSCSETMRRFIASQKLYVFAGFIRINGQMNCRSIGDLADFSQSPTFKALVDDPSPRISVSASGAVTGLPVVIISQPAFQNDRLIGFVSLSIPIQVANALMSDTDPSDGFRMALINSNGDIIAAAGGSDAISQFLPAQISTATLATRVRQSFGAIAGNGEDRFFAVASMIDDSLVLVGSWPTDEIIAGDNGLRAKLAVIFPVLMWVVGLGVAVFGMQRLVTRHVRKLRSAMRQFALGDHHETLTLEDPPEEFQDAQRAFNRMVLIISEADSRREKDLRDKEVLLREVHHRVKNNLQLIASIMNMQTRNARSAETRYMLAGLQRRVRGLAMLHRTLYATPDLTTVDAAELVQTVVNDVSQMSSDHRHRVKTELEEFPLYPDQAVPLSMFVAEALTNAFKYSDAGTPGSQDIQVILKKGDALNAQLIISNIIGTALTAGEDHEESDGLGSRLMIAFSRQLEGEMHVEKTGLEYRLYLSFTRRDFAPKTDSDEAA